MDDSHAKRILTLLILYRWASLLPPAVALLLDGQRPFLLPLLLAAGANLVVTARAAPLNAAVRQRPWLLLLDLTFVGLLVGLTGGWQTPFHLYAFSPLMIAAFLLGLRSALLAATAFLPIYLTAILTAALNGGAPLNWLQVLLSVVGFYLIGGTFGYASALLNRLQQAQGSLSQTHRDLQVIHELTLSLQSASDVGEVQQRVLEAVTRDLGFARAAVGLVDDGAQALTQWRAAPDPPLPPAARLPLSPAGGPAAQALLQGQPLRLAAGTAAPLYAQLAMRHAHVIPMQLREHGIGVLIVELGDETPAGDRMTSLQAIANQAAVAIGATMLCVNRARTVAVQEERLRIAQDIHDTVSQSLFGIVFTLDGCLKLLPRDPAAVAPELARALQAADAVRQEIRSSILDLWPAQLTADRFAADLQTHAAAACQAQETQFVFDIRGEFGALPPGARRSLYRIAQEALNNVAQHAAAREARVCVEVENGRARLAVRDDGRGFEPAAALARNYGGAHFGLRGMHERARALGGACHVFSKPGAGTSIVVEFPI